MPFVFDLGRVVNEALEVELVELQNSENLAYTNILGFWNWAQSHTSRRLRDPIGASHAGQRNDHF